jgi:acyl carrier protein
MTTADNASMESTIKEFLLSHFLAGKDPATLTDATPLITSGLLDSLDTIQVADFLEKQYRVKIAAHEADVENFNTVADMVRLVHAKSGRA